MAFVDDLSDAAKDSSGLHPYWTWALYICTIIQAIASWIRFSMTDRWEEAPIWVNLMFWPFVFAAAILGIVHIRAAVSDWRDLMFWVFGTLATIAGGLLLRRAWLSTAGSTEGRLLVD